MVDKDPVGGFFVGFEIKRGQRRHDVGAGLRQPEKVLEQYCRHRSLADPDQQRPPLLECNIRDPLCEAARDAVGQRPGQAGRAWQHQDPVEAMRTRCDRGCEIRVGVGVDSAA